MLLQPTKISVPSVDGKDAVINVLGKGAIIGEIALLDGKPRTADATAVTDCELFVIERRDFLPLMREEPEIEDHRNTVLAPAPDHRAGGEDPVPRSIATGQRTGKIGGGLNRRHASSSDIFSDRLKGHARGVDHPYFSTISRLAARAANRSYS
jgi:Cyclic nucleotide-binding domain